MTTVGSIGEQVGDHGGDHRHARVVDDRTGVQRAGHVVERELGAQVDGGGERAAVEHDAGRVGDAGEPVERPDREARLDEAGLAERGFDVGPTGRQVGRVEVRGGGEVEQQGPPGTPSPRVECGRDVDSSPSAELLARSSATWLDVQ